MKIQFDQLLAGVVIAGGLIIRCFGIDGDVWSLVSIAAGFVFGTGWQARKSSKSQSDSQDKPKQG